MKFEDDVFIVEYIDSFESEIRGIRYEHEFSVTNVETNDVYTCYFCKEDFQVVSICLTEQDTEYHVSTVSGLAITDCYKWFRLVEYKIKCIMRFMLELV